MTMPAGKRDHIHEPMSMSVGKHDRTHKPMGHTRMPMRTHPQANVALYVDGF